MKDVRTLLKNSNRVLFNDDEYFNKDVTGIRNLGDLKDWIQIHGDLKISKECGNVREYKLGANYSFSLTFIN